MDEKPKTDRQIYQYAIGELASHLEKQANSGGLSVVVALSRKGPRLQERVLANKSCNNNLIVITDHALPFYFLSLGAVDYISGIGSVASVCGVIITFG